MPQPSPLLPISSSFSEQQPRFPYAPSGWRAVDDSIRGGSSVSHLKLLSTKEGPRHARGQAGVEFWGHLNTETLGGAGFASQCHDFPTHQPLSFPASLYSGLDLTFLPHLPIAHNAFDNENEKAHTRSSTAGPVRHLTLVVKTEFAGKRPDGRNEAGVNWEVEVDFGTGDDVGLDRPNVRTIHYPFSSFTPTSKGRPLPPQSPSLKLDPSHIVSLSLMARSSFGKQNGPFTFVVLGLKARRRAKMGWGRVLTLFTIGLISAVGCCLLGGVGLAWGSR